MSANDYKIRKQVKRSRRADAPWVARMGDGNGVVVVPGHSGLRYVRPEGSEIPVIVYRGSAPDVEDYRVWVGWDSVNRITRVLGEHVSSGEQGGGGNYTGVATHGSTHYLSGSDPAYISTRQITELMLTIVTGLTVQIAGGYVIVAGEPGYVTTQSIDLTSHLPTGARWVIIRANGSGTLSVQDGTDEDSFADLTRDNIPTIEDGYAALWAVKLYAGQTVINQTVGGADYVDLRFAPMNAGGATALEDHDHSGDAGDGGTFDAANLTSGAATDGQVLTADGSGGAAWEDQAAGSAIYAQVVIVAKSGGDYDTIQAAIDSILDATSTKRYLVWVAPGTYTEQVTMKSWVDVRGSTKHSTRNNFSGNDNGVFIMADWCQLEDFLIETNATATEWAIVGTNVSNWHIRNVDILSASGSNRSQGIKFTGTSWATGFIEHCVLNVYTQTGNGIAISSDGDNVDVTINDVFLDTFAATSGGGILLTNTNDIQIRDSYLRTSAGGYNVATATGGALTISDSWLEFGTDSLEAGSGTTIYSISCIVDSWSGSGTIIGSRFDPDQGRLILIGSNANIILNGTGSTDSWVYFQDAGTLKARVWYDQSEGNLIVENEVSNKPIVLNTNNGDVLFYDDNTSTSVIRLKAAGYIELLEQGSPPGTPGSNYGRLYIKSDGKIYLKDDAGTEYDLTESTIANHDHSGDAGDGGTFDAANLTSGAADDGFVLTADGLGGAAWEAASAVAALDDLSDVDTTGTGTGDVIYNSGSGWVDYPLGVGSKITVSGNDLRFGNVSGGNYINIDASTGNLRLNGNATQWDDLRIAGSSVRLGVTAPTLAAFGPSGNLRTLRFDSGQHDEIYFEIQMPHAWKEGSRIYPHVHWAPVSTTTGNVVWQLDYTWADIGEAFGAPTTMTSDAAAAGGTAWVHKLSTLQDGSSNAYIDGTGKTLSSMLVCRLHRDAGAGDDTLAADVAFLEFDIHYEVDSFGSDEEYIKDSNASLLLESGDYLLLENGDNLLTE